VESVKVSLMKVVRYGWVIVGTGLFVKMTGLGFGRFAYPMLIPSMRDSLAFNYIEIGFLSGSIMLGYLLFSFIAGVLTTRFGAKKIVIASLFCSALSMYAISRLSGFGPLLAFTFAMGAGGAGAHIYMTTLPMAWFDMKKLGKALGVTQVGTGLGIIVTGLLLPYMLMHEGNEAWRQCWSLLAFITLLVALAGWVLLKEIPHHTVVFPQGIDGEKRFTTHAGRDSGFTLKTIFISYFIFGFAYNIYTTYFVAYMVEEIRFSEKTAGDIWAIFGWMCMGSGLFWGFISDRLGRREALIWNNGIISLAVLIPLFLRQPFFLGCSALLFGATFLGTVTVIAAMIGDKTLAKKATVYGLITLIHGVGQFLGTTFGGYLKEATGSFQMSLIFSLAGFLCCLAMAVFSKKRYAQG
jgi:MFS family permease